MSTLRRRRAGLPAGTILSGCAVSGVILFAATGLAGGRATDDGRLTLAQAGSMMSTPRPAPAAPAPAAPAPAPRAGSSMMNGPAAPPAAQVSPPAAQAAPPAARPTPAVASPPAPVAPGPMPAPSSPVRPAIARPSAPPPGPFAVTKTATGYAASNLKMQVGPAEILVPRAEINGSALGLDEVTALLDPAAPAPLGERLAKLTADEISIPSLFVRDREVVSALTGLSLRQVASGVVGALDVGGATNGRSSIAHAAATDIDLGLFARLTAAVAGTSSVAGAPAAGAPAAASSGGRLYGTLTLEGLSGTGTAPGDDFRIARLVGRDVSIRQTARGWANDIATAAQGGPDAASPEMRRQAHAAMADLFDAVTIGSMEMSGLESTSATNGNARLGRLAVTGSAMNGPGAPASGASIQLDDFDAGSDNGRVRVASVAIGGISIQAALSAFRDWSGTAAPDEKASAAEMRRFVPQIGSFRMSGLGFDTPAGPGGTGPVHVDVAAIEGRSGKPVDGLPTDMQFAIRDVTVPIAADAGDDASQQLASLGYSKMTATLGSSIAWDPAKQEIAIRDLSLRAGDVGSVTVRGLIGNVSADLFSPDSALASVAAIGLTARALDISVHNDGLAERLVAREAKAQRRKPEDIRRDLGVGAAVMVPTLLGESPASRVLSQALGRFVAKPGTLTVQLKAKQPTGYGFTDYAAAPSPVAALDQFEVTATAE